MQILQQGIRLSFWPKMSHKDTYRGETIHMQTVWKSLYSVSRVESPQQKPPWDGAINVTILCSGAFCHYLIFLKTISFFEMHIIFFRSASIYSPIWTDQQLLDYMILSVPYCGVWTKCQMKCCHFVRTFFVILHFVCLNSFLASCPDHLNMFWHFVRILKWKNGDVMGAGRAEAQKPKTFQVATFHAQKNSGRSARKGSSRQAQKGRNCPSRHSHKVRNHFSWTKEKSIFFL